MKAMDDDVAGNARGPQFAPHDVLAILPSMEDARRAVQALQSAGIEATRISLFGPAADEAAASVDVREADGRFAGVMWRRTWVGALIGAGVGALFGAVGAGIVLRGAGPDAIGVFWAAVVGAAVLGLGTGAATGATSSAQMSRAWELTFHTVLPGEVGVAVHSDDPREALRAEEVLRRLGPTQLERFDLADEGPSDARRWLWGRGGRG
jgi:hypothetical protein